MAKAVSMLCTYRVKKGKDKEFLAYLEKHWATLDSAGLVSPEKAKIWRGVEKSGAVTFIETFSPMRVQNLVGFLGKLF